MDRAARGLGVRVEGGRALFNARRLPRTCSPAMVVSAAWGSNSSPPARERGPLLATRARPPGCSESQRSGEESTRCRWLGSPWSRGRRGAEGMNSGVSRGTLVGESCRASKRLAVLAWVPRPEPLGLRGFRHYAGTFGVLESVVQVARSREGLRGGGGLGGGICLGRVLVLEEGGGSIGVFHVEHLAHASSRRGRRRSSVSRGTPESEPHQPLVDFKLWGVSRGTLVHSGRLAPRQASPLWWADLERRSL